MARLRSATATSAGGIVIRQRSDAPEFVAGQRRRDHAHTWTLPKGTPIPGETTEQTALREVAEETGLDVRIIRAFDSIQYTFIQRGTRIHKTVHYFLMEPVGGDLTSHDQEFEDVRWVAFHDAAGLLTFETERDLVARAAAHLAEAGVAGAGLTDAGSAPPVAAGGSVAETVR